MRVPRHPAPAVAVTAVVAVAGIALAAGLVAVRGSDVTGERPPLAGSPAPDAGAAPPRARWILAPSDALDGGPGWSTADSTSGAPAVARPEDFAKGSDRGGPAVASPAPGSTSPAPGSTSPASRRPAPTPGAAWTASAGPHGDADGSEEIPRTPLPTWTDKDGKWFAYPWMVRPADLPGIAMRLEGDHSATMRVTGVPPETPLALRSLPGWGAPPVHDVVSGDRATTTWRARLVADEPWVEVHVDPSAHTGGWLPLRHVHHQGPRMVVPPKWVGPEGEYIAPTAGEMVRHVIQSIWRQRGVTTWRGDVGFVDGEAVVRVGAIGAGWRCEVPGPVGRCHAGPPARPLGAPGTKFGIWARAEVIDGRDSAVALESVHVEYFRLGDPEGPAEGWEFRNASVTQFCHIGGAVREDSEPGPAWRCVARRSS